MAFAMTIHPCLLCLLKPSFGPLSRSIFTGKPIATPSNDWRSNGLFFCFFNLTYCYRKWSPTKLSVDHDPISSLLFPLSFIFSFFFQFLTCKPREFFQINSNFSLIFGFLGNLLLEHLRSIVVPQNVDSYLTAYSCQ